MCSQDSDLGYHYGGVPVRSSSIEKVRLTDLRALCFQGVEESYDAAVTEYFQPYHHFVDKLLRFGFNHDRVADQVIACSKCLCCRAIICVKYKEKKRKQVSVLSWRVCWSF